MLKERVAYLEKVEVIYSVRLVNGAGEEDEDKAYQSAQRKKEGRGDARYPSCVNHLE